MESIFNLRPALSFLKKNAIKLSMVHFMRWEFVPEPKPKTRNGFSAFEFVAIRLFEDPGRQR